MTDLSTLYLNFMEHRAEIYSDDELILKKLNKDFSYFKDVQGSGSSLVKIEFHTKNPEELEIPMMASSRVSPQCITYDRGNLRYLDYHGKLRCLFDFAKNKAIIYSKNKNKSHEILYLLILSRVGKSMDLAGFHRIHGFGVCLNKTICLGMMPSKGGKSTLLQSLLEDSDIELVSDDTPLINDQGEVFPFPIRIGRESPFPDQFEIISREENLYTLDREFWGKKYLLSIAGIKNKVFTQNREAKIKLFIGRRYSGQEGRILKIGKVEAMKSLFWNCVIGHGLPIIFEYFWENGLSDFFRKARIAISRFRGSLLLVLRSECYEIQLGRNLEYNKNLLIEELKRN